ncbi:MAG: ParB/RepB/Spo0J family partition protein [Polyangiaceae bacterium]
MASEHESDKNGGAFGISTSVDTSTRLMRLEDITVERWQHRSLQEKTVGELRESIAELGLLQPIVVDPEGNLVSGQHRYFACFDLGLEEVPVVVMRLPPLAQELARIDENLIRAELSVLERAEQLARRKEIFEQLHPAAKRGGAPGLTGGGKAPSGIDGFVANTAKITGRGASTIREELRLAQMRGDVRAMLRPTKVARSKGELQKLERLSPELQLAAAERIASGDANSVPHALELVAPNCTALRAPSTDAPVRRAEQRTPEPAPIDPAVQLRDCLLQWIEGVGGADGEPRDRRLVLCASVLVRQAAEVIRLIEASFRIENLLMAASVAEGLAAQLEAQDRLVADLSGFVQPGVVVSGGPARTS